MSLLVPQNAFDDFHEARHSRPWRLERDKLTGIAITAAIHLVIAAAALTAVEVAKPHVTQELSVQITPLRPKPAEAIKPLQHQAVPTVITAPPPDVVIQTIAPPPMLAAPPATAPVTAAPQAAPRDGAGQTRDSFLARLLAQLNRFKQYPRAAARAHIEGVVMLHFMMDAQGKVLSFEIAKSSGRRVLDNEALALIARAQPLPALPADFPTRTLDAVVPIEFSLQS
jgi:periplasmic protein TonB